MGLPVPAFHNNVQVLVFCVRLNSCEHLRPIGVA